MGECWVEVGKGVGDICNSVNNLTFKKLKEMMCVSKYLLGVAAEKGDGYVKMVS